MAQGQHEKAIKAAEKARSLWKAMRKWENECNMLFAVSQGYMAHTSKRKEKVRLAATASGYQKALKASKQALTISRYCDDKRFVAKAHNVIAEVYLVSGKPEEALKAAQDAVSIFRELPEERGEAYSLVICAHAHVGVRKNAKAKDEAAQALQTFQKLEDELGEDMAMRVLEFLEGLEATEKKHYAMVQQMAAVESLAQGGPIPVMQAPQADEGGAAVSQARPRTGGTSGPLSLGTGLDIGVLRAKITETTLQIIGDEEEEEIEADTPLMEAGLTSNTAVLLRDEISREIPGITLPPTLIFDYPSINAMSDFILQKSKSLK